MILSNTVHTSTNTNLRDIQDENVKNADYTLKLAETYNHVADPVVIRRYQMQTPNRNPYA